MKKSSFIILPFIFYFSFIFGQKSDPIEYGESYLNWYSKDYEKDEIVGASVNKAYQELLADKQPKKKVVVAIIDSGVDIDHEDLKDNIWVNKDEIPDNGIDDDQNGYMDDIHGWNFIGTKDGQNIFYENLEMTRIVRRNDPNDPQLARAKVEFKLELLEKRDEREGLTRFQRNSQAAKAYIKEKTGKEVNSMEDITDIETNDPGVKEAMSFLSIQFSSGLTEEDVNDWLKRTNEILDYHLNRDYTPRYQVGDKLDDLNDRDYGNPNVTGNRATHGTGVAGIIGAIRGNNKGVDGIANHVELMVLRTVPMGDERDKDVALSIMYAADNGADIVNMSFGKSYYAHKEFIEQAIKYAEEKGVLLIHASGNESVNTDIKPRYPNDNFADGYQANNWIEVGACQMSLDKEFVASFSNYGQRVVDIFAPGVDIVTTDTADMYGQSDGTSFAAPVVTGVAALVLAYYPELTAAELKEVLLNSAYQFKKPKKVLAPTENGGKRKKKKFIEMSTTGGVINAYQAILEAQKRSS